MAVGDCFITLLQAIPGPGLVIEWAGGVGDAPVAHRALGVQLDDFPETAHRLFLVKCVAPDQATHKPRVRLGHRGGYRALVFTEIKVFVHSVELVKPG
jgi:hypothetical protein